MKQKKISPKKLSKIYYIFIIIPILIICSSAFCSEKVSSVFPFYYYSSEEKTTDTAKNLLLFHPFIEWSDSAENSLFALRPVFSYYKEPKKSGAELIYPIFSYNKTHYSDNKTQTKWTIFPIFYYKKRAENNIDKSKTTSLIPLIFYGNFGVGKKYFILLPLIFYAKNSQVHLPFYLRKEQNFAAFVPFYGKFTNFLGKKYMEFILFPLYVKSEKEGMTSLSFLWPFTGIYYGEKIGGFKLWPLFAYTKKINKENKEQKKFYYLWPLGHHIRYPESARSKDPTIIDMFFPLFINYNKGENKIDYYFPFWGRKQTKYQTTNSYLFPLLMLTKNTKYNYFQYRILGIILNRKKGENNNEFQLLNIFGYKTKPNYKRAYILWPIFSKLQDDYKNYTFKRTYLFPFYLNQKNIQKDGTITTKSFFLPFMGKFQNKDKEKKIRNLWMWWYTDNDSLERNWAPFWTFYEKTIKPNGYYKKSVFRKLYTIETDGDSINKELNFLIFSYKKHNKESYIKLFGLIRI